MKFMLSLLALGYVGLATPSLPLHPGGIGGFFKGPNSEIIVRGPDGSEITSVYDGGEVHTHLEPIVVAEPEVTVVKEVIASPPVVAVAPVVAQPVVAAPIVEAVAIPAPEVENDQTSDLVGPSGRIRTKGSRAIISGPASTTISGPGVIAKGPPLVATPVATPIVVSGNAVPSALGPSPIIPVETPVDIASVFVPELPVSASPISVTASPLSIGSSTASHGLLGTPAVTLASPSPTIEITANPQIVATGSTLSHLPVDSYSISSGTLGEPKTLSVTVERKTFSIPPVVSSTVRPIDVDGIHRLPVGPSTVNPVNIGSPHAIGISPVSSTVRPIDDGGLYRGTSVGPAVVNSHRLGITINDQVDLSQLGHRLAVDHRQINLNPATIPAANIIPPEISVTPRVPIGSIGSTPETLLTTPGLSAVAGSSNIQREENDVGLSVTPNTLSINPNLIPEYGYAQNQRAILDGRALSGQQIIGGSNIYRPEDTNVGPTPSTLQINPQISLTPQQIQRIQNQQALLNNQLSQVSPQQFVNPDESPRQLFTPNPAAQLSNIQREETLTSNLDQTQTVSQIPFASVPLVPYPTSSPDNAALQQPTIGLNGNYAVPQSYPDNANVLRRTGINGGLGAKTWARYGRQVEKEKKDAKEAEASH